jgi:hypothetical protein
MDTIKHLFLDLEDTVITPATNGWHNTNMINVEEIKKFIALFKPNFIHIFSFAIWDETQKTLFNLRCRPMIESTLDIKLNDILTVDDDIIPACCSVMGLNPGTVTFDDASSFWSKHESFRLWCRLKFKYTHLIVKTEVLFLDDVVFNEHFNWPDLQVTGNIVKIKTL